MMSEFDRRLSEEFMQQLISGVVRGENAWLCDMLRYWRPSGNPIGEVLEENPKHLRLAIRNGYVNFYRAGQSVAKVVRDRCGNLQAKIHNKYVYGNCAKGQGYVTLTSAGSQKPATARLAGYDGITSLHEWISNANGHRGKEKPLVDLVVAQNPNVVDLEVGLTAYSDKDRRRAPRMDLVAIGPIGAWWQVVFWEAKLVDDGRARCQGNEKPKVCEQLDNYTQWLRYGNHTDLVAQAYQCTCRMLVHLRDIASHVQPDIAELGLGIRAVAPPDAPLLKVDDEPRLLIDDRTRNAAFTENGHLRKLRDECRPHVQMVQDTSQMTLEARA